MAGLHQGDTKGMDVRKAARVRKADRAAPFRRRRHFPALRENRKANHRTFVGRLKNRIDRFHGAVTRYRTKHPGWRRLPEWVPAHTPHLTGIPLVALGISNQHSIRTWPLYLMNDFPIEALKNGRAIHTRLCPIHSPECHLVEVGP